MSNSTFTMDGRAMLLEALVTPDAYTPPENFMVALTRTVPVANARPSQLTQPSPGGGYAQQSVPVGFGFWNKTLFGEYFNGVLIEFPEVTASWGRMLGYAIIEPERQICISTGPLAEPFTADVGMVPYLPVGSIYLGIYD